MRFFRPSLPRSSAKRRPGFLLCGFDLQPSAQARTYGLDEAAVANDVDFIASRCGVGRLGLDREPFRRAAR